jgi:hypothetical protein
MALTSVTYVGGIGSKPVGGIQKRLELDWTRLGLSGTYETQKKEKYNNGGISAGEGKR